MKAYIFFKLYVMNSAKIQIRILAFLSLYLRKKSGLGDASILKLCSCEVINVELMKLENPNFPHDLKMQGLIKLLT